MTSTDNRTTELLNVGDILWNEPCDERIVVIAANERNVWLRKVQKNDELAMYDGHVWAMLGKKCNVKNMCTQSYAQSVFELDGHVEQAIDATLVSPENTFTLDEIEDLYRDLCDSDGGTLVATVDGVRYETDWGYGVDAVRHFVNMLRRRHGIEVDV